MFITDGGGEAVMILLLPRLENRMITQMSRMDIFMLCFQCWILNKSVISPSKVDIKCG